MVLGAALAVLFLLAALGGFIYFVQWTIATAFDSSTLNSWLVTAAWVSVSVASIGVGVHKIRTARELRRRDEAEDNVHMDWED